jgi:hypothetical protein
MSHARCSGLEKDMTRLKTIVTSVLARLVPKKIPAAPVPAQRTAKHFIPAFVELPELEEQDDYRRSGYN